MLARPRVARFVGPELRDEVLSLVDISGLPFTSAERVAECRDAKDDKFLELALAAGADRIDHHTISEHAEWSRVDDLVTTISTCMGERAKIPDYRMLPQLGNGPRLK